MSCIFCKIADKSLATPLIYEDDELLAFRDIHPQAPSHILIIPKKHIASLNDSDETDLKLLGKLLHTAKNIAHQLKQQEHGYRLVMNIGQDGGQTVYHIHLHLLAGRTMTWPPG